MGAAFISSFAQYPIIPYDNNIEEKVSNTLATMTLDEKIGQMVQLEVGMITYRDPRYSADALFAMSEEEWEDVNIPAI